MLMVIGQEAYLTMGRACEVNEKSTRQSNGGEKDSKEGSSYHWSWTTRRRLRRMMEDCRMQKKTGINLSRMKLPRRSVLRFGRQTR